jgi:ESCRT-II complex subunit VPS22
MRRGLGAAGIVKRRERDERMNELGTQIEETRTAKARALLEIFKTKLSEFAEKHRSRIQKDPEFREQFVAMCESVGVDPVRSNKSFWADVLLGMGSFYTDIAVQVLTIAITKREQVGPLLPVTRCLQLMQNKCSTKDLRRAVKSLSCFGNIQVVSIGGEEYICTLPSQHGTDHTDVLGVMSARSGSTSEEIASKLNRQQGRILHALHNLVRAGVVWIDDFQGRRTYWPITSISNSL